MLDAGCCKETSCQSPKVLTELFPGFLDTGILEEWNIGYLKTNTEQGTPNTEVRS